MKMPEEALKRWLHPAVFAIWAGFLIYILASRRYVGFLRPEFGILLALALFIAMGFMLAAMIRPKTEEMNTSAVLRSLVLLVPVLYFVAMPEAILGNQAFKTRFIGTNNGAIGRQAPSILSSQGAGNDPDIEPPLEDGAGTYPDIEPPFEEGAGNYRDIELPFEDGAGNDPDIEPPFGEIEGTLQKTLPERTILEIFSNPNLYKGQRVIVTGMILRDEQLKPHFGGRDTAVYRFLINCCAADALPLAIALDADKAGAFANDQWVQVDGVFDLQQINGKPVPIVSKPHIKPIEAPAVPYLF